MRTAVHVDDAIDVAAGLVDDRDVPGKLRNLTGPEVRHLARDTRGKTLRVGIDVVRDILFALCPRPRLVRHPSVWRIDDRCDRGTEAARRRVAGKIFDVLEAHRHGRIPDALQVRLSIRCLGRRERLGFRQRTRMKACGRRRTTSRDGVRLRILACGGHRGHRQGNRESRRCDCGAQEPFLHRSNLLGRHFKTKSIRIPGFERSSLCDGTGPCSSSTAWKTSSDLRWWLRS